MQKENLRFISRCGTPHAKQYFIEKVGFLINKALCNRFGNENICALICQKWSDTDDSSNTRVQNLKVIDKVQLHFVLHFPINPPPHLSVTRRLEHDVIFAKGCRLLVDGDCLCMDVKENYQFFLHRCQHRNFLPVSRPRGCFYGGVSLEVVVGLEIPKKVGL